ncbi:MAG: glycoside hydrolase family 31 protein [Anaerolineales bacterium]
MHTHIFGTYTLQLETQPFSFSIVRNGQIILQTAPHEWRVTRVQLENDGFTLHFAQGTLRIATKPEGKQPSEATAAMNHASLNLQWRTGGAAAQMAFNLLGHWYGQGELIHQPWTLERAMQPFADLLTADNGADGLLCVQTPLWLCSTGVAIFSWMPLTFGMNQPPQGSQRFEWDLGPNQAPMRLRPQWDAANLGDNRLSLQAPDLSLEVVLASDVRALACAALQRLPRPSKYPPAELFSAPIWTTWARYKVLINQETVLRFAEEIVQNGYPHSVMEIDDIWQDRYGDLFFSAARFPDPAGMVARLHELGFKVTVWVMPFVAEDSLAFAEGRARGLLVRAPDGEPYALRWWQGTAALLDVTNPEALAWFLERLRALQAATGVDGFKFDAGEGIFLPSDAVCHTPLAHPNEYTRRYVAFVAQHFALTEVRSAWFNQDVPIFVRQWDKTTVWGADNGLESVIPGLLHLGLTGYRFVLPDMVGGNAYAEQPEAELMIRWAQVNALLPAMQFSLAPWEYGEACNRLCRAAAELHARFAPRLLALAEECVRSGLPLIRPVWWLAPEDEAALLCGDEFLLGEDVLVAPVVQPGAVRRDIYLPPGVWRDDCTGAVFTGAVTLRDYPAPLDTLPIFERVQAAG